MNTFNFTEQMIYMVFEDLKFKGKHLVKEEYKKEILNHIQNVIFNFNDLSTIELMNYIEILLGSSEYSLKRGCFFEEASGREVTSKMFSAIAAEYIQENIDEFLK